MCSYFTPRRSHGIAELERLGSPSAERYVRRATSLNICVACRMEIAANFDKYFDIGPSITVEHEGCKNGGT